MLNFFVAIDTHEWEKFEDLIMTIYPENKFFKIGLESTLAFGLDKIFDFLKDFPEIKIFLDLKLHDIPNTVLKSLSILNEYVQIQYLTIHSGNNEVVFEELSKSNFAKKILLVASLTSYSDNEFIKRFKCLPLDKLNEACFFVRKYRLGGVICSGQEVKELRKNYTSEEVKLIVPGIEISTIQNDQERKYYLKEIVKLNCNSLVIGRQITQASEPIIVIKKVKSYLDKTI
ncbi:MAG: orotidine-5'-phosphate decarboxylase [Patescibacteria group bacterium]